MNFLESELINRQCRLESTHIALGSVDYPLDKKTGKARHQWLKNLYAAMQTSKWTPNAEAFRLLRDKRLQHAAMSVGDAVSIGRDLYIMLIDGFKQVDQDKAALLLPQEFANKSFEGLSPGSPISHSPVSPHAARGGDDEEATASEPKQSKKNKKNKGKGKAEKSEHAQDGQENGAVDTGKVTDAQVKDDEDQGGKANSKKARNKNRKNGGKGEGGKGEGAKAETKAETAWQGSSDWQAGGDWQGSSEASNRWDDWQGSSNWQGSWGDDSWKSNSWGQEDWRGDARGGQGGKNGRGGKGRGKGGGGENTRPATAGDGKGKGKRNRKKGQNNWE